MFKVYIITILLLYATHPFFAQDIQYYNNDYGEKNVCGSFPLSVLETDSNFNQWFKPQYEAFALSKESQPLANSLKHIRAEVYMGTWCEDSRSHVPKLVKLYDDLGLDKDSLSFVALYDDVKGKYKQSPDRIEETKQIHHLPTLIFFKGNQEIGRIVESPVKDIETDITKIMANKSLQPKYPASNYLMRQLDSLTRDEEINISDKKFVKNISRLVEGPYELNNLGKIYLDALKMDNALFVLQLNTLIFKENSMAFNNYAKALEKANKIDKAIENYEKTIRLDDQNTKAKANLERLKKALK